MKIKNNHIVILAIILFGIFFSQCKKYEEDDVFMQWKKPEKRLIKYGPWVFDKLTVDGIDKSAEFRADSAYFDKIEFSKPLEIGHGTDIRINRDNGISEIGLHQFTEDKRKLKISGFSSSVTDIINYGPIFQSEYIEWEILKLSKKGIKLKTAYNGSEYIMELKPDN